MFSLKRLLHAINWTFRPQKKKEKNKKQQQNVIIFVVYCYWLFSNLNNKINNKRQIGVLPHFKSFLALYLQHHIKQPAWRVGLCVCMCMWIFSWYSWTSKDQLENVTLSCHKPNQITWLHSYWIKFSNKKKKKNKLKI